MKFLSESFRAVAVLFVWGQFGGSCASTVRSSASRSLELDVKEGRRVSLLLQLSPTRPHFIEGSENDRLRSQIKLGTILKAIKAPWVAGIMEVRAALSL